MDYQASCRYSIRLIDKLKSLDTKNVLDFDLINKAIYWAKKYHGNQKRKSGEAYYTHPLEVAYIISDYKLKTDVIVASILHDIIEDTEVTAGMILDNFGWRITEMVDILTRDRPDGSKLSVEEVLNNAYQKQDEEVLLIKLFDRFHNMQTIACMIDDKKNKISEETIKELLPIVCMLDLRSTEEKLAILCNNITGTLNLDCYNFLKEKSNSFQLPFLNLKSD